MTALLRAVRRQRGLTLEQLAEQTGLTKSYLSKIERGQSTPSIAVALKVARALDVDVGRLFSDEAAEEKITVDRSRDRAGRGRGRYHALASALLGKSMSPFVVRPTDDPADDPHPEHAGQEFVFVHAGSIELDYGDQTIRLDTGDSAYFDASVGHTLRAVGDGRSEVVVVTHAGR
ncbi:DNA-binding protein [Mycobacterium kansasii]|uniref:HTH-type transcriptional regulator SutR n=1 Tax=Mycobacterium attenuatum TaxID=2341086 RepID=A0A498Q1Y9_9MYCO|nr:XRE family transcriptional regulator [Mycobacterium attenuatum]ORB86652.1 DNA-binding protein [Mycobacterium kansasii]VBA37880.1 HTH-type transcriptional regulator SutR [Mycobacterium attenuatum]VBA51298.1 HTH-type transcriptional regulator SutR [Mycobacterium attenuatum]VBA57014.1 HTH-type transcriptional regulator SutR [Mycobacterium attenuatum]